MPRRADLREVDGRFVTSNAYSIVWASPSDPSAQLILVGPQLTRPGQGVTVTGVSPTPAIPVTATSRADGLFHEPGDCASYCSASYGRCVSDVEFCSDYRDGAVYSYGGGGAQHGSEMEREWNCRQLDCWYDFCERPLYSAGGGAFSGDSYRGSDESSRFL